MADPRIRGQATPGWAQPGGHKSQRDQVVIHVSQWQAFRVCNRCNLPVDPGRICSCGCPEFRLVHHDACQDADPLETGCRLVIVRPGGQRILVDVNVEAGPRLLAEMEMALEK